MRLAALMLAMVSCVPALAHDYWGNGQEVDAATRSLCCGQNDCKEVEPAAMHIESDGRVHFDDTPLTISATRIMPSPDGRIWRCVWGGEIKCLFAPLPGF